MAAATVGFWAQAAPGRTALIHPRKTGPARTYSYQELDRLSSKMANVLAGNGIGFGDRVAILLSQGPEAAIAHLGIYKLGAIAVPLFTLFGEDGLKYRMKNSGSRVLITDGDNLEKALNIRADLPDLEHIFSVDGGADARDFWAAIMAARDKSDCAETKPDTPALLVYTSGTTGPPKGAVHGHRMLIGHLPGVETHHDFLPASGDCLWTPADWAWMGGLANVLLPGLYHGVPVVAHRMAKFDPDGAFDLMRRHEVRNVFLPPTALKFMRQSPVPGGLHLRSVASGGEALGAENYEWGRSALGVRINEFYGSTECNLVLGNCASVEPPVLHSTGRAIPGKDVCVLGPDGTVLGAGEVGEFAVRRGDPAMFLGYWGAPEKTASKYVGDWMLMGDEGHLDAQGRAFFSARTDDVIMSSGYRIGPSEIEDCLSGHDDVALAAAIGVPDADRGEVVKAFVVLADGASLDEVGLIEHVRQRLSPHLAPREVVAIDALPMTATGKIMRRELKAC